MLLGSILSLSSFCFASDWSIVSFTSGSVNYSSLVLDTTGYPHIAYYDGSSVLVSTVSETGVKPGKFMYSSYDGAAWSTSTIDTQSGKFSSLVLDASGCAHTSYYDGNNIKYAKFNGVAWSTQTVDSIGTKGTASSIVIDPEVNISALYFPYIAYYDSNNQLIKYNKQALTGISGPTTMPLRPYTNTTLSDQSDSTYERNYGNDIRFDYALTHSSGLPANILAGRANIHSVVLYIRARGNGYDTGPPFHIYVYGTGYVGVKIGTSTWENTWGRSLYSYFNTWTAPINYNLTTNPITGLPWTVNDLSNLHSWNRLTRGHAYPTMFYTDMADMWAEVSYTEWDGVANSTQTVTVAQDCKQLSLKTLKLGATINSGIAYTDTKRKSSKLMYAAQVGTATWTSVIVDSTNYVNPSCSLALSTSGVPCISYFVDNNRKLKYAVNNSSSNWTVSTVDTGLNKSFNNLMTSLTLDTSGYPHIAYTVNTSTNPYLNKCALKYAAWNGSSWYTVIADSSTTRSVGESPSLVLDNSGYKHVAYSPGRYAVKVSTP